MRSIYIIIVFFVLLAVKPAKAIQKDTTYKRGVYLIEVSDKTNIDIVRQGAQLKHKTSKGDTLFEAENYVVLGDDTNISVLGIFKRFHVKQKFSDFSVIIYKGKLAKPDFGTNKDAYGFRTQIRTQCKQAGVNFAGHYTLVIWGCGSDCQQIAIVDRVDGKIYYSDNSPIIDILAEGLKFRPNSLMIVVNSGLLEHHKGYVECSHDINVNVVEWINNKVRKLPE